MQRTNSASGTAGGFLLKALIFANGELELPPNWQALQGQADLVLAADGGSRYVKALGLELDAIVGDMDSISADERAQLEAQGVDLVSHPAEKDHTDLELALQEAQARGATQLWVLAALGRRWDHSFANLMLAAREDFRQLAITYLHGPQRLFLIRGQRRLQEPVGTRISLIPLGGQAQGVRTAGLHYPLNRENLPLGSSRGVSNLAVEAEQLVELSEGTLLCVLSPGNLN